MTKEKDNSTQEPQPEPDFDSPAPDVDFVLDHADPELEKTQQKNNETKK